MNTWKPIFKYETDYEVSDDGQVRRLTSRGNGRAGQILHQYLDRVGYLVVYLSRNGKARHIRVHKLVMEAFVNPMPVGYTVNHKDGNKLRNTVENLEYMTPSQNSLHAQHDLQHYKIVAKLSEAQVVEILNILATGINCQKVAKMFNVSGRAIASIKTGDTWKWIPRPDMSKANKRSKLTKQQISEIHVLIKQGAKQVDIANTYSIAPSLISRMKSGEYNRQD